MLLFDAFEELNGQNKPLKSLARVPLNLTAPRYMRTAPWKWRGCYLGHDVNGLLCNGDVLVLNLEVEDGLVRVGPVHGVGVHRGPANSLHLPSFRKKIKSCLSL